jgi:pimeloyl-ACP methyl ester carboxylesterase
MLPVAVLLSVLLIVAAALVALVTLMMARFLLAPPRMTGGLALWTLKRLTPQDLNLPYEELAFDVRDESTAGRDKLRMPAWWIPAAARGPACDRCAIIVHGYGDSKIGGIAWAPTFREMGYNVLAIDLRAHGKAEGRHTTAGCFERHDVSQIIDQLRAIRPTQTRRLIFFGVSLGAAVAGAALELRQQQQNDGAPCDIDALIMDCPYRDFPGAAHTHAGVMGMPGPMFQRMAVALAQRISGADFHACSPVDVIPRLRCPLMVIHAADDLFIDPAHMDAVESATRSRPPELGPTVYWRPERTHHVLALASDPKLFRKRLEEFLAAAEAWRTRTHVDERPGLEPQTSGTGPTRISAPPLR